MINTTKPAAALPLSTPADPYLPPSPTASIIHAHLLHVQLLDLLMRGMHAGLELILSKSGFYVSTSSLLFNGGAGSLCGLVVSLQHNLGALKPIICIPDAPVKDVIFKVPLAHLDILVTAQRNQIQVFKRDNDIVSDSF